MMTTTASERIRVETGVPGAVTSVSDSQDGVLAEYNGAGSVVAQIYLYGLEEPGETLAETVARLTVELRDAKRKLKAQS